MRYEGKASLVFGGTANIGRAVCLDLARQGAEVAVHYRSSEGKAEEIVEKCNGIYDELGLDQQAGAVRADAKSSEEIKGAIDGVIDTFHQMDFLVNAFTYPFKPEVWEETDEEKVMKGYTEAFAVDVLGTKMAMDHAMDYLKNSEGAVVNFSSSPVISGHDKGTAYSTAKAGVRQLTMDYARKYGPDGVRINAVAPGWVPKGTESEEELAMARESTPLRQLASPELISEVVADILGWRHVTGQTVVIDGGEVMR